ncbi:MAG: PDZ domain-containing protein, partial [Bacteroidaceae bacterium]|nr:PDZ domain-containing protein [Bacteroidaceae bacterium]
MKRIYALIVCVWVTLVMGVAMAQISDAMRKLNTAVFAVREMYVDTVNETEIVEDMINHMLQELDPHSSYTTAEETRELNEPLEGNFSGIGIQFNIDNDTLLVVQIIAGGPSERVGMQAGDRIIAVNDSVIAGVGLKTADVRKFLRGPEGTKVNVRVLRQGVTKPIDFRITREQIPIYSVDAAY